MLHSIQRWRTKQYLRRRGEAPPPHSRGNHLFNPALFALLNLTLLYPAAATILD